MEIYEDLIKYLFKILLKYKSIQQPNASLVSDDLNKMLNNSAFNEIISKLNIVSSSSILNTNANQQNKLKRNSITKNWKFNYIVYLFFFLKNLFYFWLKYRTGKK